MLPFLSKRKKTWTKEDLTKSNIDYWDREGWPIGIKIDIARVTPIKVPGHLRLRYRQLANRCDEWIIAIDEQKNTVHIHKWFFPHPSRHYYRGEWLQGRGFIIPARDCVFWRTGIAKLIEEHKNNGPTTGNYVYAVEYLSPSITGFTHRVRFFLEHRLKHTYYNIQDFRFSGERYYRSRNCVYCTVDNHRLILELDLALEIVERRHKFGRGSVAEEGAEIVRVPYGFFDEIIEGIEPYYPERY